MIDGELIVIGVLVGIAVAAPMGPVNLMCIRYTMSSGFLAGVLTGAGAVLGDGTFAAIAAFSLTALGDFFVAWSSWLQAVGGVVLVLLGLRTFLSAPDFSALETGPPMTHYVATFCTAYFLTITNPATMMGFAAIFGGVGGLVSTPENYGGALTIVLAVMAGSLFWWLIVAGIVSRLKERMNVVHLTRLHKTMGLLIFVFGLVVGVEAFRQLAG